MEVLRLKEELIFLEMEIYIIQITVLHILADKLIAADTDIIPDVYHACGGRDPWLDMNHIVRDYFLEHKDVYKNYTYDEIDELGHEWRFWDIELNKFLDYAGLKEVRPAKV